MKTIIVYSTKYGSVKKAAAKLMEYLKGKVTMANVKNNPKLADYDTIILGGSVYMGTVQKEMRQYIKQNLDVLLEKKLGLFVCAGARKEKMVQLFLEKAYPQELREKAVDLANLGYEYDLKRFSLLDTIIVRMVGVKRSESVFFDDRIKEFAGKITG